MIPTIPLSPQILIVESLQLNRIHAFHRWVQSRATTLQSLLKNTEKKMPELLTEIITQTEG